MLEQSLTTRATELRHIFHSKLRNEYKEPTGRDGFNDSTNQAREQLELMIVRYKKKFLEILQWMKSTETAQKDIARLELEIETVRIANENMRIRHQINLNSLRAEHDLIDNQEHVLKQNARVWQLCTLSFKMYSETRCV